MLLSQFLFLCICLTACVLIVRGMAGVAETSVDSKAELTSLLEQWEREQQGSTQDLVTILTKYVCVSTVLVPKTKRFPLLLLKMD